MILKTSNAKKIKEFSEFFPDLKIEKGEDKKEVLGTIDEVITYKTLEEEKNVLTEDTILLVNGKEIVDIKWKIKSVEEGDKLTWITSIGYHDGETVFVSRGIINGIAGPVGEKIKDFDPYFFPEGSELSLEQLAEIGRKSEYSARIKALQNIKAGNFLIKRKISEIEPWNGQYQNEE